MTDNINQRLDFIGQVWSEFISRYNSCQKQINYPKSKVPDYFIKIIGYFNDMIGVVFDENQKDISNAKKFSNWISLLQAIYVQQDLISELLFYYGLDKDILKYDDLYKINRDIRNELVGHPIRIRPIPKDEEIENCKECGKPIGKKTEEHISFTLFSYDSMPNTIEYLIYHRDNNYSFDEKSFKISEIQTRHREFLIKYLDQIINKQKKVLDEFCKGLKVFQNYKKCQLFDALLKSVEERFEFIFSTEKCYDKDSLTAIFAKRTKHKRYDNFIECFKKDLEVLLSEKIESIDRLIKGKETDNQNIKGKKIERGDVNFTNEIGKLYTTKSLQEFDFNLNFIRKNVGENELIIEELKNMEAAFFYDDIEYFTSLMLIRKELNF